MKVTEQMVTFVDVYENTEGHSIENIEESIRGVPIEYQPWIKQQFEGT